MLIWEVIPLFKGFINYKNGRIPFVIENYRMELFTDDSLLSEFTKEHNKKTNYELTGRCFRSGSIAQPITILVEKSSGSTCFLSCFYISLSDDDKDFDCINFQSTTLDNIFRYKYNYLNLSRAGENFSIGQKDIYYIPFTIGSKNYNLKYKIGQKQKMGILEDFEMCGETSVTLNLANINECYKITILLERFSKFISGNSDISFKRISLSKNGVFSCWFYCRFIPDVDKGYDDIRFYHFDVMKYSPIILNNISLNLESKITKSIYLGHIGNYDTLFSPQRFISQVMAFEYLFEKLEPKKANDPKFSLKKELELMFNSFPNILKDSKINSNTISKEIKTLRVEITHGYSYYYDFKNDKNIQYYILMLDELIEKMNLKYLGFNELDISNFRTI